VRRFYLFMLVFLIVFTLSIAVADEYFELKPGFVTALFDEGVGFYTSPSFKNEPIFRIGPGVSMYLAEVLDNGWASIRFLYNDSPMEGYVRTGTLVMNDYGLGGDVVRLVSDDLSQPICFYQEPYENSEVHGQYFTGTLFNFYGVRTDGFARVALGEKVGYIPSKYLFAYNSCTTSNLPIATVCSSSNDGAYLSEIAFQETTALLHPITQYPNGTEVVILGITPENWCHVMINGRTGYISHSELQLSISYQGK